MAPLIGVLFDGVAYGSLLYVISLGLSITMGVMGFVNLAHGAFAMMGGFTCLALIHRFGIPFLATLPLVFLVMAAAGAATELLLYRRLYRSSSLDQVLFTIGLTLMTGAAATWVWGPQQQPVELPSFLRARIALGALEVGAYRLFLILFVFGITGLLALAVTRSRAGAQLRAAVDNPTAAAGSGIHVALLFTVTFALGSGLAGVGGALAIDVLGLDPSFALKYLVYFLLVVVAGGAGSLGGSLVAALLVGIADVAGKYYVPQIGSFIIYASMVLLLVFFPRGLHGRR